MCPAPTTIRRERPRMRGSCAMRSGGSSYAKSVRFIDGAAIIRVSRSMRAAPVLLLLGILVIAAPLAAQKNRAARVPNLSRILVVTAHPDDESLFAPILGAYCRVMSECTLLVMTHGENGPCVLASGCGTDLAATRASELTAAAALLHTSLILWTLPDVMSDVVNQWGGHDTLVGRIAGVIEDVRPTAILTFDPAHGTTCHPAHRAVGSAVAEAAGDRKAYFLETRAALDDGRYVLSRAARV